MRTEDLIPLLAAAAESPLIFWDFGDAADVVLLQPDGKIIVGGLARPGDDELPDNTALARYKPDGSLDPTFGKGGKVAVNAIGNVNALALQSDVGIIVLDGSAVARFDSDGELSSTVTGGAITAITHTGNSTFQADGRFVLAGAAADFSNDEDIDVKTIRFARTGATDPTFNSPIIDFFGEGPNALANIAQALLIEPNRKVVVAGISNPNSGAEVFGLARYEANGKLDSSFGNAGKLITQFFGTDQVLALVMQSDARIIAVGQTFDRGANRADLALTRYLGP